MPKNPAAKPSSVIRHLRFPPEMWAAIQKAAKQEMCNPSQLIRRAVLTELRRIGVLTTTMTKK